MTEFQITQPEPFVLGSGENKYPGGYVGKVLLNGHMLFETLAPTPRQCQQDCVWWCIIQPPDAKYQDIIPSEPTPASSPTPEVAPVSTTTDVSGAQNA